MTKPYKPRLRKFEDASGQRHVSDKDRFLYRKKNHIPDFRFNIIGSGTMGQEHMFVTVLLGEACIHGIYDIDKLSMQIAKEEYASYASNDLILYDDLETACNDTEVDALIICTPNFTHYEVLKIAIKSEKPIFLEKPMATDVTQAFDIFKISQEYPTFIQIGLQYRFKSQYREAYYEAIERKIIGNIKTISMSEYRPPFLDKVKQWNKFSSFSGGTLVEKCCHYFDLISLFSRSNPIKVYAAAGQSVNFLDFNQNGIRSDIDDNAFVIIEYENGIRASFILNMFSPIFQEELILCGEMGKIEASEEYDFKNQDHANSKISIQLGENDYSRSTNVSYSSAVEKSGHHGATYFEHMELINRLNGLDSDSATPKEGLWSIVLASAAQESISKGSHIMMDEFLNKYKLSWLLDI
tara:strand:+ start:3154 stop:4383 length:1230 start_codon:yes stop_codon:yes gene_type:complete